MTCNAPNPHGFLSVVDGPLGVLATQRLVDAGVLRWVSWDDPAAWLVGIYPPPAEWVACEDERVPERSRKRLAGVAASTLEMFV